MYTQKGKYLMIVLVTGGAGYIGSHACKALKGAGYTPVVFDNLENGHGENIKWGSFFKGDLRSPDDLREAFEKYQPEAVLHFAAYAYVGESVVRPDKYYQNNMLGSFNLLEAMKNFAVKKLVFSSSCATYGSPEIIPITENQSQKPINPYGNTKLLMEMMMRDYAAANFLSFVALRYFNAAGADPDAEIGEKHSPETHLIPLVLDAACGRRAEVKVFGNDYSTPDGTCVRDYIHVSDLADAHIKALKFLEANSGSRAFNLGNGKGFSVLEIINGAEKVSGRKIPFVISPRREGDPAVLVGDAKLAYNELGWKPKFTNIEEIILHAWNYHKKAWSLE